MFGYSRFIIRAATPATFVREGFRRQSGFCTNVSTTAAATLLAAVSKKNENAQPSSSTSSDNLTCKASQTTTRPNKINISCCGFPKNMIGGPSYVVESNVYGDDACFIANFKSTHVAGKFTLFKKFFVYFVHKHFKNILYFKNYVFFPKVIFVLLWFDHTFEVEYRIVSYFKIKIKAKNLFSRLSLFFLMINCCIYFL